MQSRAAQPQRPDHRDFRVHQLLREAVLLKDLRFAPALGPVKLGNHGATVLQLRLVNPVFVRRKRGEPTVAPQANGFEGVQNQIGRQRFKNMVHTLIVSP